SWRGEKPPPRRSTSSSAATHKAPDLDYYDSVAGYVNHGAFRRWKDDPDEPRRWGDVVDFLGADPDDPDDIARRVKQVRKRARDAIDYCNKNDKDFLTKEPARTHPAVHFNLVAELIDFLQALSYRFPQLDGEGKRPPPKG